MSRTKDLYRNDPAYREKQKKHSRYAYWGKRPIIKRPSSEVFKTELRADITLPNGKTVRVPVYRISTVAQILGKSVQTVHLWEEQGRIPKPTLIIEANDREDRAYTYDQVRLIWNLMPLQNFPDARDQPPAKPRRDRYETDKAYKKALREWEDAMETHRYDHNAFSRELKRRWDKLIMGIRPDNPDLGLA